MKQTVTTTTTEIQMGMPVNAMGMNQPYGNQYNMHA